MLPDINLGLAGALLVLLLLVVSSFRILREYERGVVFLLKVPLDILQLLKKAA